MEEIPQTFQELLAEGKDAEAVSFYEQIIKAFIGTEGAEGQTEAYSRPSEYYSRSRVIRLPIKLLKSSPDWPYWHTAAQEKAVSHCSFLLQSSFASNKGYGAQIHIEALKKYGPCPIHRKTFITHFVS